MLPSNSCHKSAAPPHAAPWLHGPDWSVVFFIPGLEYTLEHQSEAGIPIDLDTPLCGMDTLEFCLVRENSKYDPTPTVIDLGGLGVSYHIHIHITCHSYSYHSLTPIHRYKKNDHLSSVKISEHNFYGFDF